MIDPYALFRVHEMGRGVEPCLQPVRHGDGLEEGRGGAFSVSTDHLHGGAAQAVQPQSGKRTFHTAKPHIHMEHAKSVQMTEDIVVAVKRGVSRQTA